jgi:hypothetical protein
MIELTDQLRQAVRGHPGQPVRLVDPDTQETFVLVPAEVYDRLRGMLYDDAEFPISEAYPLMDEVAAKAGWDDPAMDIYDDFAPKKEP